jgi:hypothetical protein
MWKRLVFADTEDAFWQAWAQLQDEFFDQEPVLAYLQESWLPLRSQWAHYCIKQYLNWSVRVTSQTESANFTVKSYLLNSNSDLFRLVKAIQQMCEDQKKRLIQTVAEQQKRVRQVYLPQVYLGRLPRQISYFALDQIAKEHRQALRGLPTPSRRAEEISLCDENCTVKDQMGLPCRHMILNCLRESTSLVLTDIDRHWHLDSYLVSRL